MKVYLKKIFPKASEISKIKILRWLNIAQNFLWCFSRRFVARAFFIGLFCAMLPVPIQTLLAGVMAIYFRANLPISIVLVWLTNPLTIPIIFYFNYRIGVLILKSPAIDFVHFSWHSVSAVTNPLLLGSFVMALILGTLGYWLINWIYIIKIRKAQSKLDAQRKTKKA